MKDNPSHFLDGKGGADKVEGLDTKQFPVETVSWDNAQAFCMKMRENDKEGRNFRLPTEAEWEYSCRTRKQTTFFFGDDPENLGDYAWFWANSGGRTHQVGQKKPNAWGLHDMHGNVWQWCEDEYESRRLFRGGSWFDIATSCRAACRQCRPASDQGPNIGFRVAFSVE
jgi:formylglycine-generating enzyme required for sulfatase activity